jgi:hypothetical protein
MEVLNVWRGKTVQARWDQSTRRSAVMKERLEGRAVRSVVVAAVLVAHRPLDLERGDARHDVVHAG